MWGAKTAWMIEIIAPSACAWAMIKLDNWVCDGPFDRVCVCMCFGQFVWTGRRGWVTADGELSQRAKAKIVPGIGNVHKWKYSLVERSARYTFESPMKINNVIVWGCCGVKQRSGNYGVYIWVLARILIRIGGLKSYNSEDNGMEQWIVCEFVGPGW